MTPGAAAGAHRKTGGALRLVEASSGAPRSVDISSYVREMRAHCPYLGASLRRGLTTWTVYRADGGPDAAEAELFHAGARAAEWLRPLVRRPHGWLRCENLVVLGGHPDLLVWPHWVLKNLYGPVGIMFGRFAAGAAEFTRCGARVPAAPVSFLPVRPAVRRRDPALLRTTPGLAAAVAVAEDDGRDVFAHLPHEWTEIRTWTRRFLPPVQPPPSCGPVSGSL
ncbi:hypothetical protein [Streptomyces sp. NPDC048659]|uniref:hypothetical protein n=1 Tax=Streptomyces sp. NPDC048659 TaxID=3155489 RepID=UPI00342326D1